MVYPGDRSFRGSPSARSNSEIRLAGLSEMRPARRRLPHSSSVLVALVLAAILLVIAMILAPIFLLVPMVLATILHNVLSWGSHILGLLVLLKFPCWEMDDNAQRQR